MAKLSNALLTNGSDIQATGPLLVREMMAGKTAVGGQILFNGMILLVNEVKSGNFSLVSE